MTIRIFVIIGAIIVILIAFNVSSTGSKMSTVDGGKNTVDKLITVACVGDSITRGSGASDPEHTTYPGVLQSILGKDFRVLNYGDGGTTALKSSEKPYWKSDMYLRSLKSKPNYVVIMFGTNDSKKKAWKESTFEANYMELIKKYQALPTKPVIFVCVPPPYYAKESLFGIQGDIINKELPRIVPKIAKAAGTRLVNIFHFMGGDKMDKEELLFNKSKPIGWPNDGIHPNDDGYEVIANQVSASILEYLNAHGTVGVGV
jgi:acyl-CoA thioesterase I